MNFLMVGVVQPSTFYTFFGMVAPLSYTVAHRALDFVLFQPLAMSTFLGPLIFRLFRYRYLGLETPQPVAHEFEGPWRKY